MKHCFSKGFSSSAWGLWEFGANFSVSQDTANSRCLYPRLGATGRRGVGAQSMADSFRLHGLQLNLPGSSVPWNCPGKCRQTRRIKVQQEMHVYLKADSAYLKLKALQMHSWERYCLDRQSMTGSKFRLDPGRAGQERRPGDGGGDGTVCGEGF